MALPLASIRVVDVTNSIAGPFAAMCLGDLGAEVIKVEPPTRGDTAREWGPRAYGGLGTSFLAFNRNKKSLGLDLTTAAGKAVLHDLLKSADVLLTNTLPDKRAALGLDYDTCAQANPTIIYCGLGAYGDAGPMRCDPGYDALMQARSGLMSITGEPDGNPIRVAPSIIDMGAGMWAAISVLAAVVGRKDTGAGRRIETSLFETAVAWSPQQITTYLVTGEMPRKYGSGVEMLCPYEAFPTADGFIMIAANTETFWQRLCEAVDAPELLADDRFKTNRLRVAHRNEVSRALRERLLAHDASHWERVLTAAGVPSSRVATLDGVVADEQTRALEMIRHIDVADGSSFIDVAPPFTVDGARPEVRTLPPALGGQSCEVLAGLGYTSAAIADLVAGGIVNAGSRTA